MKILDSDAATVTLGDLVQGFLQNHRWPRDSVFHVQAALDCVGLVVPDEVLHQLYATLNNRRQR